MLVPELNLDFINKVQPDQYGRVSSVLLLDKPAGITSHDLVDDVRKILRTRKVGHAGALDPFATGLVILLVGKYTKYAEAIINLAKSYEAEVILGLSTLTQDPEGEITDQKPVSIADLEPEAELEARLQQVFMPGYNQVVPIFSSVKVEGNKLRVLAREAEEIKFNSKTEVEFLRTIGGGAGAKTVAKEQLIVELPEKPVQITEFSVSDFKDISSVSLESGDVSGQFVSLKLSVSCSKGTYIRQLAQDLGEELGVPAYLKELRRSRVANFAVSQAISLSELYSVATEVGIQAPERKVSDLNLRSTASTPN